MSNILKLKLSLIAFSFLILVLIPLCENNFYGEVSIKRWQQLNWDDFQGFVKPFTGWGAGINCTVYLEYDSLAEAYIAYAGQNNQLSWK
jgi:hypothetical protein